MTFHDIEGGFGEDKKAMLIKDIAEIHGKELKHINENINANRKRFIDGIDIVDLKSVGLTDPLLEAGIFTKQSIANANNIYLLSERGYSKLLKILEDDIAWEKYEQIVDGYFNMRAEQKDSGAFSDLSPQLQLLINMEMKQKELEAKLQLTDKRVDNIREIVALNPTQWRKDTTSLINKMALKLGGYEHIKTIREESYKLLEQRYGVQLGIRLTNKKKTLALNGVCKSKIDKVNQVDVIADDKKLVEGYVAIIKELSIKYGIDISA